MQHPVLRKNLQSSSLPWLLEGSFKMTASNNDKLLKAFAEMPDGLTYEDFVKHPSFQALNADPFTWRELFELYELPGMLSDQ
jgi:hypothetical protein